MRRTPPDELEVAKRLSNLLASRNLMTVTELTVLLCCSTSHVYRMRKGRTKASEAALLRMRWALRNPEEARRVIELLQNI